ncbi:biotin transporter BioY [Pseudogracilibacillus auburnensis]|uniref:biotin transporter BioY n=1 Tax=Pseudogracilibacillus auburnensis TaxID=1494959 RepID=UPI001A95D8DD|nr:biotin transporter BioY [Pseudogracilibacillus auburnensis]MBO1001740.1 biotin transporter BioY [Pseudogracilibacillus auburnensis]
MTLKDMMYISLFAAIVGALAFFPPIPIPFIPVPITAQTLGVMLAGGILGARRGGLSLLLFVLLVAIGAPLMAGGRGGLGILFGPGGGYILAWPIAAFVIGYLTEKSIHHLKYWKLILINTFGGIIIVYLIGVTYLAILTDVPWGATAISSLVFLPGDFTKVLIASAITIKLHQAYPMIDKVKQAA